MLSTKAFSSLLTKEWIVVFKEWITYPVLAVSTFFFLMGKVSPLVHGIAEYLTGFDRDCDWTDKILEPSVNEV